MPPKYSLEKIKYATDAPTFHKAVSLHNTGRVTNFETAPLSCSAVVLGTEPYHVIVSLHRYTDGQCDCYLGQREILCKHVVAVALYAVQNGRPLSHEDTLLVREPICSGHMGLLTKSEVIKVKKNINVAIRYIKDYQGPSRIWFAYQSSLTEGCNRLAKIISDLPISEQTATLMVDLLLRLDEKISHGVDDSNGTVGNFIESVVSLLEKYARIDPACIKAFRKLERKQTCFGWEEPLVRQKC